MKLQKQEELANKKYKETCRKQEFVKNVYKFKNEKIENKMKWYEDQQNAE